MVTRRSSLLAGLSALTVVYAACVAVARSASVHASPRLVPLAVAFDLTVTATLVAWWTLVRPGHWPARRLRVVAAAGLAASALLVPGAAHYARALSIALEAAVLAVVLVKLRAATAAVRARPVGESRLAAFEAALAPALGRRFASILATEVFVLVYALAGFRMRRREDEPTARAFTDHQGRQLGAVVAGLLLLTAMEGIPIHLLLARASPLAAWLVLAIQLYGAAWLVAEWQAHRLDPIVLTNDALFLNVGLRLRARVPLASIATVGPPRTPKRAALNATAWTTPTIELVLHAPMEFTTLAGLRRNARVLHLSIDDPETFSAALHAAGITKI